MSKKHSESLSPGSNITRSIEKGADGNAYLRTRVCQDGAESGTQLMEAQKGQVDDNRKEETVTTKKTTTTTVR